MPRDLFIYDVISNWWGVSALQVRDQLAQHPADEELVVRINSPGGDVFEGTAIANMIRAKVAKKKTCCIDGLAASMASVIALAADEVVMAPGAMFMIHDPSSAAWGTAEDMRAEAEVLDKVKQGLLAFYRRSGKSDEDLAALMAAETWYTAEEAVAAGFADRLGPAVQLQARLDARFRAHYAHMPTGAQKYFIGAAPPRGEGENMEKTPTSAAPPAPPAPPPPPAAQTEQERRAAAMQRLSAKHVPQAMIDALAAMPVDALERYEAAAGAFPQAQGDDRPRDLPPSPRKVAAGGKESTSADAVVARQLGIDPAALQAHREQPWHKRQQVPSIEDLLAEEEETEPEPLTEAEVAAAAAVGVTADQLNNHRAKPWHKR